MPPIRLERSTAPSNRPSNRPVPASALCRFEKCTKRASFGLPGPRPRSSRAEYCLTHCPDSLGYYNVRANLCVVPGCTKQPSYGLALPGAKATHCVAHSPPGSLRVRSRSCIAAGCAARSTHGPPGSECGDATYCRRHCAGGQLPVIRGRRCLVDGCETRATCGFPGKRRKTHCGQHRLAGHVRAWTRKCSRPGCDTYPSFGPPGGGPGDALSCVRHTANGYLNIGSGACEVVGCSKIATYSPVLDENTPRRFGSGRAATRCMDHKLAGFVSRHTHRRVEK